MLYLEKYYKYLADTYHAKSSIKSYYFALEKTKDYFYRNKLIDDKLITEKDILNYIDYLKDQKVSPVSFHTSIARLKGYFDFLENEKIIFISPMQNIELPKRPDGHFNPLSVEEINSMLDMIKEDNDHDIRAKMIIEVLYSTGMRPKELLNIKITHIDFKEKLIFIEQGKNKKDRVVPVGITALRILDKYINEIRVKYLRGRNNYYLMMPFNRYQEKLGINSLFRLLNNVCIKYNIPHFNAYSLRFSYASHLLINGVNILYIQKLLGHSNIKTTQIYLRVKTMDLKNELVKKHPRFFINNITGGLK
jgi:integrase/recombinase XerD